MLTLFHEVHVLGAAKSFLRVSNELAAYGWTASGWIPGSGALQADAEEHMALVLSAERPLAYSVRGWREEPGAMRRLTRSPGYLREVRAAIERIRPHVVHANTLLSLPEATVARSCGLPVVLQAHELPPQGLKTSLALWHAARVADVLVGVSDAATAMLRRYAGRTPVLTVRNGVPTAASHRRDPAIHHPFTVGSVGTVSRTKGTDVFLHAARLALSERPAMRFEHVGARDLHRDAGLDEELAVLQAELSPAAFEFRGSVPAETALPQWDVFVSSSRSDAFPLATLEAMAAGLPVIATTVGGIPEQIDHLETGVLVRPDDPEAVATWLIRLHDEPELRFRLGSAAAVRARREFTLAEQAAGLHRAYILALNRRFAPAALRRRPVSA